VLADVRRGIWRPPHPEPTPEPVKDPTFHGFASERFEANEGAWRPNTRVDYGWQLTNHLLPFFAKHRLSQITIAEVDRSSEPRTISARGDDGLALLRAVQRAAVRLDPSPDRE
jgi:hypothetical protein